MLKRITDYFLPQKVLGQPESLSQNRIFINVLLITALTDFLGANNALGVDLIEVGWLLIANMVICLITLFLYKAGLISIETGTHIHIAQHAVSFAFQGWFQGGLSSPAVAAFFLLPAVAMLTAGKKTATIWFFICSFIIIGYYVYEQNNPSPIPYYSIEQRGQFFLSAVLGTYITIFVILLVYQNGKNKALNELHKKHNDLISTQARLIQTEKLASLGEMTAGIAHEIQNPLNFVNNFSEVNEELIEELLEERNKKRGERDEGLEAELISDLKNNLKKINHHGQRASSIVKGMLEHSRPGSSKKELTNINALADEYLRLAYHGFRAKDKSFNAEMITDFDPNLPKIEVVPQDIGRVLLNLINNAFQAVQEEGTRRTEQGDLAYKPLVSIRTETTAQSSLLIAVTDNGPGIPEEIKDKIFQPFFTTKPTGQGTGLGLSLAYDIIKTQGGLLEAASSPDGGAMFTIKLPLVQKN
ncbi:sensor histidine kinase [Jiulongibacter sediminis]|uniref:sensor histidine kinase n=1 Tax=Jiulongibacter sediminis TaxID=1605367 RepID=UPI0006DC166E|nr:ATP-binding protein [Jiulongibacter sediminis]